MEAIIDSTSRVMRLCALSPLLAVALPVHYWRKHKRALEREAHYQLVLNFSD